MTNPTKLVPVKFKWCPSCAGCLEGNFFCATCDRDWSPVAEQAPEIGNCGYQGYEFGASYPDSICGTDGYLWDADSGDSPDALSVGGDIPCPQCNREKWIEYCRDDEAQAPVSGFDKPTEKPVADLIDEAAKQTIRVERLQAENERLRKELGRAHNMFDAMNENCTEQFDRAELAETKLDELKAWKQDWQETIDCAPFCEFGEELEQIISNSPSVTAQTTPTAELLALPGKWRRKAMQGMSEDTAEWSAFDKGWIAATGVQSDELQAALDKMQGSG